MSEHSKFKKINPQKLVSYYQPGVAINSPRQMSTLLMSHRDATYSVPLEVARVIYNNLGAAIQKADRVNEYKIQHGYNPSTSTANEL